MVVNYAQVIQDSRAELKDLVHRREEIDKRIAQLIIALRALARFLGDAEREGLMMDLEAFQRLKPRTPAEAISAVLKRAVKPLTSNEIRERLEEFGFDLGGYSQPLGTIFTTLARLEKKGDVRREKKGKIVTFGWNRPLPPP